MSASTLIIAEAGVNHNGDIGLARELIDVAADAGADVVKFQTFNSSKLVTKSAEKAAYQKANTGTSESQQEMLAKLELSFEAHFQLKEHAEKRKIEFLSSPFDDEGARFLLEDLKLGLIKIPSGEITNAPMLLKIARSGAKCILSTGMCDLMDIELALGVLAFGYTNQDQTPNRQEFRSAFHSASGLELLQSNVTLLHCTSDYPAKMSQINLRAMSTLTDAFGLNVGYSDHTEGISISVAAVALGAKCIEKHFTLDKTMPGPDHKASLDPLELKQLVQGIRSVEAALGSTMKRPQQGEISTRSVARKSLVASQAIRKGDVFTVENVTMKRPGTGASPMMFWDLLGTVADREYGVDDQIKGPTL